MPSITTAFLGACNGCTYDQNIQCLVTSPTNGLANSWFTVINDQWALVRDPAKTTDAASAQKLSDPNAIPTGGANFKIGNQVYMVATDPNGNPVVQDVG